MNAPLQLAVRVLLIALVSIPLCSRSVGAQATPTSVQSFADLSQVIKPGTLVMVTDEKGQRIKGTAAAVSDSMLEVRRATGVVKFPADRVSAVARIDSRGDGFLYGFLAGGAVGGYLGIQMANFCAEFLSGWSEENDTCPEAIPIAGGMFGLIGGAIGAIIDNLIDGETPVFNRPSTTAQLHLSPLVGARSAGIRFNVKF